ncbi:hypothetical protein [Streptomyces longwoodensis]|uniref:hypothetical protein n=1 Tax=Streptomyces longwoodensis TaxID=68231 RepID=UPI00224E7AFF|nr:hypothetical protein [Streptomyces longwoodensis]MCX4993873.1 hypothetical protein [Streptomyces longwoodensis]
MTIADPVVTQFLVMFEVRQLTAQQQDGTLCVWCDQLLAADAIDLGGAGDWRPHSCPACYLARKVWRQTYFDWLGHTERCEYCARNGCCTAAYGHRIQHEQARQAAGKPPLRCGACLRSVQRADLVTPLIYDGGPSAPLLMITHVRACPTRRPA